MRKPRLRLSWPKTNRTEKREFYIRLVQRHEKDLATVLAALEEHKRNHVASNHDIDTWSHSRIQRALLRVIRDHEQKSHADTGQVPHA